MNQALTITSIANPKIKWLTSLHKHANRRREGIIVVEGAKEIDYALQAGFILSELFVASTIARDIIPPPAAQTFFISQACFDKVSYRSNSDGLIGVIAAPHRSLSSLQLPKIPLLIIVESVEKPGNLGAIIRTADGAAADAVIVCDERCDIWNPNVIRASVGTVFSVPVIAAHSTDVVALLKKAHISPFAAAFSRKAHIYTEADFTQPTALIFGTEAEGLSDFWLTNAQHIIIPMHGKNDSLNVSVAAGIIAYEARRQRS